MGNYITSAQVESRVTSARLEALAKLTGDELTALITAVIARAESLVDGYLAVRYTVPVPANDLCAEWALAIVEHELYKRGSASEIPEKIRKSYEDTVAALKDASAGRLNIPSASRPAPASSSGLSITVKGAPALMDHRSMEGF